MRVSRRCDGGFTLVEVLLAAAIAAILAVSVIGALNGIAEHLTRYREETQLAFLLQAVAGEIIGGGKPATTEGSFDSHPDYRWKFVAQPIAAAAEGQTGLPAPPVASKLQALTITVTAPSGRSTSGVLIAS